MGSCHPNGRSAPPPLFSDFHAVSNPSMNSLYEKPLDLKLAQQEHANFRLELEKYGCVVMTVREILAKVRPSVPSSLILTCIIRM